MRGVVWAGAVVVGLAGCAGGERAVDRPSRATSASSTEQSSASPGAIGRGARCPEGLPGSGLPREWQRWQARGFDGRLVGPTPPEQVMLCRYTQEGQSYRWVADRELRAVDGQQVIDDLRSVPQREETITACARRAEPTPFVLLLTLPNDEVHAVRADADPTCAYAGASTTNGAESFEPIGNDLLAAWRSGRWEGVTR
ncbi:hypothetical protein N5P18_02430 [Janibacter terrae]|uniref:DUF3558 domain-containing protein n=1 Tax=Janibacter terrae TaxID=103817 RepID=A0ABZ2FEK0_9MICO